MYQTHRDSFVTRISLTVFVLLITVSTGLAAPQPRQVTVAVGKDSVPYYFLDRENRPRGLVVDIWNLWSRQTGIEVIFRPMAFGDTLEAVRKGDADVQAGCFFSPERSKTLEFVSPVVRVRTHFFFRRNIFGVKDLSDLKGFRIGIIKGDAAIDYLNQRMPGASLAVYPDNNALFAAVKAGEIVAFVKDTHIALAMLAEQGLSDQYRYYEGDPLYEADWLCAVRRGNTALAEIVREGMDKIPKEDKAEVIRRWTGAAAPPYTKPGTRDTLTIACSHSYPPMTMINASGNPSGMLVDLWQLWARKTGRNIRFRFFSWEDSLASLATGDADIHSGLFRSREREGLLRFSRPFYQVESGFFYKRDAENVNSLKALAGKPVGVEAGTLQLSHLNNEHGALDTRVVPSGKDLIQEASKGAFDVFFAELPYVYALLERRGEQGIYGLLPEGRVTHALHAGVSRANEGLAEEINKGFKAISPAELADIEARWIRDPDLRQLGTDVLVPMLTSEERGWLKAHPVIPILGESDWAPLDYVDRTGGYTGVAADYINLIGRHLGVRFEVITDYSWRQMISLAKSGKANGITCIAKRKDREVFLNFTTPYFVCPYVIITRRDAGAISGIQDLKRRTIAVEDGFFLHGKLMDEFPGVAPLPVKNTAAALEAVRSKKADAYVGNLMVVKHLLRERGIEDLKVAAPSPWPGSKLRMGIRKDWPLLASAINKAIESIPAESHREINRRWQQGSGQAAHTARIPLSPKEKQWLKQNKVVVVASESGWPPINFVGKDGTYRGITADYLDLISRRTGLRLEIITDYAWSQMLDMAENRQVDMISAVVKTPDREGFLEFTDPYFVSPYVIVTRNAHRRIEGVRDLAGETIAVENGFYLHRQFETEFPEQKLRITEDTLAALKAVASGEADAYTGNLMVIRYLSKLNGISGLKVACPAPWPGAKLRLGIRKDWPELAGIVGKALADITAGEHQAINRKWMDHIPGGGSGRARLTLTGKEQAWLSAHPEIRLGIDPAWPPFEFLAGDKGYSGLASAYMARVAERLGIGMTFREDLSWSGALALGQQKEIDVFPCITPSPERAKFLRFTKPYLSFPMVIAAGTGFPFISSLDELAGKKVAVVKGYLTQEVLAREHGGLHLIEVESVNQGLNRVSNGRADAFVGNLASITYFSRRMGLTNIKIAATTPYQFDLSVGVRDDWPELVSILDKALDAMTESEKNDIHNAFITMRFEHGTNWQLFWRWILGMGLVSASILGIILYSNTKLKAEVAERERAETAMREAEAHSRLILESVGEGIIGQDTRGQCTFVNRAALDMLGLMEADLLGRSVHDTIHHSREDNTPYALENCPMCRIRPNPTPGGGDEILWRKDGSFIRARYSSTPIRKAGQVAGAVISFSDITFRKMAEDQLRKLSKAVEQSPVSVVITDPEGTIEYVNPMFSKVTGYTTLEALGENPRILKSDHTPAETYDELWKTITQGKVWQGEFRNKKKDGELIWEAANISPIYSSQGEITHFLCVKEDITRRKEMEASLIDSHEKLSEAVARSKVEKQRAEEADKAKGEFLANMSHEIRTPMNAIIGMTHLVFQTDLDKRQADYVGKIDRSAKSLLGLINDILDFSKIEAGKLDMEILEFSLDQTLENLAGLISVKAGEKENLEVLFRVDHRIPDSLSGDPLRLNQVLVNLGNNAVKFTEHGHIIVAADVLEIAEERVILAFSVTDTGIGMSREQQDKLFKAFSQGDTSTTRKYGGTGLGLIISKRIVEMMGGEIRLESEAGKGSCFSFTVPFGIGRGPVSSLPAPDAEIRKLNVLVIDDNPASRQIFMDMLAALSVKVDGVGSGREGVKKIQVEAPDYDVLMVDYSMPEMDGLDTARQMMALEQGPDASRIILMCAREDDAVVRKAHEMDLAQVLVKPVTHSGLFNALMSALGHRDAGERLVAGKGAARAALPREVMGARILLVEDHDINQQVAVEILEGAGFLVDVAENGARARDMALDQVYDLVLMDLQMPVMDGYDATRAIRKHKTGEELPVIAMTASAMPKDRERAMAAGMNAHVSKPIDLNELFSALSRWITPGNRPLVREAGENEEKVSFLPEVPGIEVARALSRLDRNQALYLDLLGKFRRTYARADSDLKVLIETQAHKEGRGLSHAIKGVAGNIGMVQVQAAAEKLEFAFRDRASDQYEPLLAGFTDALEIALTSAGALCKAGEEKNSTEGRNTAAGTDPASARSSANELADMLAALAPYIKDREAKPAKDKMKEIAARDWPDEFASRVAELETLISRYRFKPAGELMMKLMAQLEYVS